MNPNWIAIPGLIKSKHNENLICKIFGLFPEDIMWYDRYLIIKKELNLNWELLAIGATKVKNIIESEDDEEWILV